MPVLKPKALITGITGQDGSYLAEYLLDRGYEVHGLVRNTSNGSLGRIEHVKQSLCLHQGDMGDCLSLVRVISTVRPDEIYNLAAQSHVQVSFDVALSTSDINGLGILRILDIVRSCGLLNTRVYQASTSEMFGGLVHQSFQDERTPFAPRSPYAISKVFAHWTVVNYREAYNVFAVSGILFNHESPRRGPLFVTSKIISGLANFVKYGTGPISLGNLEAKRDFGHAKDYVRAMWLMLQGDTPVDYCICSGAQMSIRSFLERAFSRAQLSIEWSGEGLNEIGLVNGIVAITIDPSLFRPTEVDSLLGCSDKARKQLGWEPTLTVDELIDEMLSAAMEELSFSNISMPQPTA